MTDTATPRPTDDDFEEMLAGFDRLINDKKLQQQLLDAGLLVRIQPDTATPRNDDEPHRDYAGRTCTTGLRHSHGTATPRNEAAERLRTNIRAAIRGMNVFWASDDGDSEKLADAMMIVRQTYARDLRAALAHAEKKGREEAAPLLREFVRLSYEKPASPEEEAEFAADLDILTDKVDAYLDALSIEQDGGQR